METKPETVFRRTMIAVNPDYFSWTPAAQERYRIDMPREDSFRVKQTLLKTLFGLQVDTKEQLEAALDSFSDEQYLLLNSTMLYFNGIGDDQFYLNEYVEHHATLLDFETLSDFDCHSHNFQEGYRQKEQPDYVIRPYRGTLYGSWARLRIDGAFFYASLWMLANYLSSVLDEIGFDKLNELIPHEYVEGQDNGKREGKGTIWDTRIDAKGQEGQLEALQQRYYRYLSERHQALSDEFDTQAEQRVYLVEDRWKDDPHLNIVFTDKTALQRVRFRHFMTDCRGMLGDNRELDAHVAQGRQLAIAFLEQNHQDIMENFDPKIAPFRQKRKIIIADGALDGLL